MAFTIKKQNFARKVVELDGNQSAAYRAVYNCENMKPETIAKRASELMRDGEVAGMVAQLRQRAAKRHDCTVDSLVAELEEIKQVALSAETPQTSAAVSAVMGKAKLCGLDKQVVEHTGGVELAHTVKLTDTQRRALDEWFDANY